MQRRSSALTWALTILVTCGVAAGLWAAGQRWRVEQANRSVEVALEWSELDLLARTTPSRTRQNVFTNFRLQGVTTLVFNEDTVASLQTEGVLQPEKGMAGPSGGTRVRVTDGGTLRRIRQALDARGILTVNVSPVTEEIRDGVPETGTRFVGPRSAGPDGRRDVLEVAQSYAFLRTMGLGLPPAEVEEARGQGFRVAARVGNFAGVSPASAEAVLRDLRVQGATLVIFSGDEVLGFRGVEKAVAQLLRTNPGSLSGVRPEEALEPSGVRFGAVEFGKQKGDASIQSLLRGDYVRVHSVQTAEIAQLSEAEVVDRFTLAARERNIRFLYIRLFTEASASGADGAYERNKQIIQKIVRGLGEGTVATGGGLRPGPARPYGETHIPALAFALMGVGVAAGFVALARSVAPLSDGYGWLLLLASSLACAGAVLALGDTGRKLAALAAGIVFPALACVRAYPRSHAQDADKPAGLSASASLLQAARGLVMASAVTLLGVAHVVGLLATRPFMLRADQFLGIKAQHALPILLVGLLALAGGPPLPSETSWRKFKARVRGSLRRIADEPARFGMLLIGLVALVVFLLIVARTGNDSGVGASGVEMKFRALLDRTLPVRPRTKEFLLGHPAFLLALAWWARGRRRLALPMFVAGSIGQVSLLNTFCHIHTPLVAGLWRGGLGVLLGALLGAIAFLVMERLLPPPEARTL